jgi:tetratricopeptide (TPR) repeat protein
MGRPRPVHVDSAAAVGRRLHDARVRAGLSQKELSFPGCSPAYVSRIEAGERVPSPPLLRELARRVGISESYLARGTGSNPTGVTELMEAQIAFALDETAEARRLYEAALARADDGAPRADVLEGLGKLELREGKPRKAVDVLEAALAASGEDPSRRPGLAEALARARAALGELAPAIALLERCVEAFEREGDHVQYVRFAALLGYALTDNGNFAEAERVVSRALVAGREVRDPYTRARLYWSQLRLHAEQGSGELAEHYARKTLETLRSTEDQHAVGLVLQTLAHVKLDLGEPAEAMELLEEARRYVEDVASPVELAQFRIEEVRALAGLGQKERAAALAMEVTAALGEALPGDAGRAYVHLAEAFEGLGESARARELYELAIEMLERQGPTKYLVTAYKRLGELLDREGATREALEVLKRAVGAQERVGRLLRTPDAT